MRNYLKQVSLKALSLVLVFALAVGFTFAINTNISFAEDRDVEVNSAQLKAEIPKCGAEITGSAWDQQPNAAVDFAGSDEQYDIYDYWWSQDDGIYPDEYTGPVTAGAPLYLFLKLQFEPPYYWANDEENIGEDGVSNYTGTITINGEPVTIVTGKTTYGGEYLFATVKIMPEHDWENDVCKGCGATKSDTAPETGNTPAPAATAPVIAKMTAKGSNSMQFVWKKIDGADGYDIFLSRCNYGGKVFKPKYVKTISGSKKTLKWTKKGLKKHTPYKGYVMAFKNNNGKKEYIGTSLFYHEYTSGGNSRYTNAKSVTIKKKEVSLSSGGTYTIKAKVNKVNKSKKLINITHTAKLRYVSTNESVATVSPSGQIVAKGKGVCNVYVIAANGAGKTIKVTVN